MISVILPLSTHVLELCYEVENVWRIQLGQRLGMKRFTAPEQFHSTKMDSDCHFKSTATIRRKAVEASPPTKGLC